MGNLLTPRGVLLYGGIILLVLGVGGMTFLGPTPEASALGEFNWLDGAENVAHLVLGVVALGAYYMLKDAQLQKWLVALVGIIAAIATVVGFMNAGAPVPNAGVTNLEFSDNIIHLVVAAWALYAAFMTKAGSSAEGA
ncbi:DUF4383 domain-containing protein [Candidatus Daviesbacteria bacterium]|nr:DUF4383 domain-containing protein [Candidatus Daviesbacteria bacterium]